VSSGIYNNGNTKQIGSQGNKYEQQSNREQCQTLRTEHKNKIKQETKMLTNAHNWQFVKLSEINEQATRGRKLAKTRDQ